MPAVRSKFRVSSFDDTNQNCCVAILPVMRGLRALRGWYRSTYDLHDPHRMRAPPNAQRALANSRSRAGRSASRASRLHLGASASSLSLRIVSSYIVYIWSPRSSLPVIFVSPLDINRHR